MGLVGGASRTRCRLECDDRHAEQRDGCSYKVPAAQGNPVYDVQPDQRHGDVHTAVRGIGSPGGRRVQGQQPSEQRQGKGRWQQQPSRPVLLHYQPGQVAADDFSHRRHGK